MSELGNLLTNLANNVKSGAITVKQADELLADFHASEAQKAQFAEEHAKKRQELEMQMRAIAMQAKQQNLYAPNVGMGALNTAIAGATSQSPISERVRQSEWWEGKDGIKTERLFLMQLEPTLEFIDRLIHPDMTDAICNWLNDDNLTRYSRHGRETHTLSSQQLYWLKTFGGANLLKSLLPSKYWFIFQCDKERRKDDVLIGTITGMVNEGVVDIGILLGAQQGHGYAGEAMNSVINHYNMRGITTFTCGTDQRNEPMIKLALTMGMREVRRDEPYIYFQMDIPSSKPKQETVRPVYFIDSSTWTGR